MTPTVCLAAIVKNEAAVIERCLGSLHGLIDSWVICDTGSTDGTQDVVRRVLADTPGELHERQWHDFGHNRSECLALAYGVADWLLIVDADEVVSFEPDFKQQLGEASSYMVEVRAGGDAWRSKRLLRDGLDFRYEGVVHAIPATDQPDTGEPIDGLTIRHFGDGGSHEGRLRWAERALREAVEKDPSDARSLFYLAQTYRDLRQLPQAIACFEKRVWLGGFEEEVFYSQWQIGVLWSQRDNWPRAQGELVKAFELRPWRMEPVHALIQGHRSRGQHRSAHVWATYALGKPMPDDTLFLSAWVYEWGILFEWSITTYYVGDFEASLASCDHLLTLDLPQKYREAVERNRQLALARV